MNFSQPRSNWLIVATLFLALVLMILPLPSWISWFRPQWVLLVLIFWGLALPNRVGLFAAWGSGLALDVLQNTVLGEHALVFTVVAYFVLRFQTRINFFPFWQKTAVILSLILLNNILQFWLERMLGNSAISGWYWLSAIPTLLFWPWVEMMLQHWQRRFVVRN